jgi:hypothetical protein
VSAARRVSRCTDAIESFDISPDGKTILSIVCGRTPTSTRSTSNDHQPSLNPWLFRCRIHAVGFPGLT